MKYLVIRKRKSKYDQFGHAAFEQGGGGAGGFGGFDFGGDMGDIFGDIFGDFFGGGRRGGDARRTDQDRERIFVPVFVSLLMMPFAA